MRVPGNPQIEGTRWLDFTVKCTESATDLAPALLNFRHYSPEKYDINFPLVSAQHAAEHLSGRTCARKTAVGNWPRHL
jgi:hypothetical protein